MLVVIKQAPDGSHHSCMHPVDFLCTGVISLLDCTHHKEVIDRNCVAQLARNELPVVVTMLVAIPYPNALSALLMALADGLPFGGFVQGVLVECYNYMDLQCISEVT